ncbi:MAG: hypothetical protein KBD06_03765 [Candidatus Pacebacteria bacterium]|nr:hypothetical protein [Candidatus Paceibacterota bacterium]
MEGNVMGGMIGVIFLVLCISFVSFLQPAERQASAHPFLDPNVASAGSAVYLNDRGTLSVSPNR